MNARIQAALQQLNAAYAPTGKVYSVTQQDDTYLLVMPGGMGTYPVSSAHEMEVRLMNLRLAAVGREAR